MLEYEFKSKQLFPINTNTTTALSLDEDILVVAGTYPPTLNLFNINTYNMIFSRQLDYEVRKIEKINDKLILLSDNYLEFHNMSRFVEKIQTTALDFKYNSIDGKIYLVNKGVEIIDLVKNIKRVDLNSNKYEYLKIEISPITGLCYLLNDINDTIDLLDIRVNIFKPVISMKCFDKINSFAIKDTIRFSSLSSSGMIIEQDLRTDSVIKHDLEDNTLINLKYTNGLLLCNNKKGVFCFNNKKHTLINDVINEEEIKDYLLKQNLLFIGYDGVGIYNNEQFSI